MTAARIDDARLAEIDRLAGRELADTGLPGLADGVDGLRFITAAVRSAAADGAWVPLKEVSE